MWQGQLADACAGSFSAAAQHFERHSAAHGVSHAELSLIIILIMSTHLLTTLRSSLPIMVTTSLNALPFINIAPVLVSTVIVEDHYTRPKD